MSCRNSWHSESRRRFPIACQTCACHDKARIDNLRLVCVLAKVSGGHLSNVSISGTDGQVICFVRKQPVIMCKLKCGNFVVERVFICYIPAQCITSTYMYIHSFIHSVNHGTHSKFAQARHHSPIPTFPNPTNNMI